MIIKRMNGFDYKLKYVNHKWGTSTFLIRETQTLSIMKLPITEQRQS